jgi:hypothetical protein
MKTSIKNLFAAALTVITLSTSAFAATDVNEKNITILNQVKNINKLVVNGNVEVILVQAPTESVKVYDSYYSKNALVQQENGVLRISSFQKETLTVTVYVRNLSTIEASNNSSVKTYGKVSFLALDVILKDNATADINARTLELYTVVKDNASLKLSGTSDEHYAVLGAQAKLSMDKFVAACGSVNASNPVVAQVTVKKAKVNTLPASDDFVEISK